MQALASAEDGLLFDLEVLDWLELFGSTVTCARLLGISQSGCSRRYRAVSERFGLGFDRNGKSYQATANLDVLSCLRQVCQKLRVRDGRPRFCLGWQLGQLEVAPHASLGAPVPFRPMDSWKLLSQLEQRLIDVAVMGLMEFQPLMGRELNQLKLKRTPLNGQLMCIPLCRWELRLIVQDQHPLQGRRPLSKDDLSPYPSPALSVGMAPLLMAALQHHGLANQPCGLSQYDEARWEGFAADGHGLSYAAPHQLPGLHQRYGLLPLDYPLGIVECLGVVGHRDVLADASFAPILQQLMQQLPALLAVPGGRSGLQWLG